MATRPRNCRPSAGPFCPRPTRPAATAFSTAFRPSWLVASEVGLFGYVRVSDQRRFEAQCSKLTFDVFCCALSRRRIAKSRLIPSSSPRISRNPRFAGSIRKPIKVCALACGSALGFYSYQSLVGPGKLLFLYMYKLFLYSTTRTAKPACTRAKARQRQARRDKLKACRWARFA